MQLQLRTLIHTELAKCEEDVEHLTAAIEHVKKVFVFFLLHNAHKHTRVMAFFQVTLQATGCV